jgi:hypothetical protein
MAPVDNNPDTIDLGFLCLAEMNRSTFLLIDFLRDEPSAVGFIFHWWLLLRHGGEQHAPPTVRPSTLQEMTPSTSGGATTLRLPSQN